MVDKPAILLAHLAYWHNGLPQNTIKKFEKPSAEKQDYKTYRHILHISGHHVCINDS
jgi:hypothetical protein